MAWFVANEKGDITALTFTPLIGGIEYNDEGLMHDIVLAPHNYKWINEAFIYTERPDPYHSWTGSGWAFDPKLFSDAQDEMWKKIKEYRDYREEEGGVPVPIDGSTFWFHSDTRSLIKYLFLMFLSTVFSSIFTQLFPDGIKWKTMSDAEVLLTTGSIVQIFFTALNTGNALYQLGRQHRTSMMASADPLNYDFKVDWPPIFGES